MLIIGAKGHAKEVLQYFLNIGTLTDIYFYDDVSQDLPAKIYDKFPVIKSIEEAKELFNKVSNEYVLGIGNPKTRYSLNKKFSEINGKLVSIIMQSAEIGSYNVNLGQGLNIMSGVIITNDVSIGTGSLINTGSTISHDSIIGNFCEISPGSHITGRVKIGDFTSIGTGSVIIPDVKIGSNCIIGAGSVVIKDIPDNSVAVGVPAKVIKEIEPFNE